MGMPADLLDATQLVEGVATDEAAVTDCIKGCSSVVVSLGGPTKGPGVDICSKAQVLINQAVLSMSPQPLLILVSSIGVGDHYQHCSLFSKFFASCIIPQAIADKKIQEDLALWRTGSSYVLVGLWTPRAPADGLRPTMRARVFQGYPARTWLSF